MQPIREPIRKQKRLEERESGVGVGVGVSDSSGFLQSRGPTQLLKL